MARKPQKLINYNTSGKTSMPSISQVDHGEIVVRWNTDDPQLLIKVDDASAEGGERFATFIDSGAVVNALSNVSVDVTNEINRLSGAVSSLTEYVNTSAATHAEVGSASANAITSANGYTDQKLLDYALSAHVTSAISDLSGNVVTEVTRLDGLITGLDDAIAGVSGNVKTLSGKVATDYATKVFVGAASGYAYNQATAYTNTLSGNVVTELTTHYATSSDTVAAIEDVASDVTTLNNSFNVLSGNVKTLSGSVVSFSAGVKTYIDDRLGTVYTVKGSVANWAALTGITGAHVGDVYNVVAAKGDPGTADYTPAGTNYVYTENGWDALGGTIDLSSYATTAITDGLNTRIETLETKVPNLSGAVETLSGKVVSDYATKSYVNTEIGSASARTVNSAKTYTDYVSGRIETALENYATSAVTHGLDERIGTLETKVPNLSGATSALSASTVAIETKANNSISAVTTNQVSSPTNTTNTVYASGVKIKNNNTSRGVDLDFSELVIDCGNF